MIPCTNEEAGIKSFHVWKSEQYAADQASGTPHEKEWYYRKYGGYCAKLRRLWKERHASQSTSP